MSERTVYLAFPRKAVLLGEIIRVAVRGDDPPVALADRADWRAMLAAPGDELLERFAALTAALMTRTAHVLALGEAAAAADPSWPASATAGTQRRALAWQQRHREAGAAYAEPAERYGWINRALPAETATPAMANCACTRSYTCPPRLPPNRSAAWS